MTWENDSVTTYVVGDEGPWARHVAAAWQACAGHGMPVPLPPDPTEDWRRGTAEHEDWLAYWAPLVQLTRFALGWTRPDLGLARWIDAGRPTEDPVLAVIEGWWGVHLEAYLAGAAWTLRGVGQQLAEQGAATYRRFDDSPPVVARAVRTELSPSEGLWEGGSNVMHIQSHYAVALADQGHGEKPQAWDDAHPPRRHLDGDRAVIMLHRYLSWYRQWWALNHQARTNSGRSLRVDVVCKPIGWVGEYRRSTETGGWFRGPHRWHVLGA